MRDVAAEVAEYVERENGDLNRMVTLTVPGRGLEAGDTFDEQRDDFEAMMYELVEKIEDRKGDVEWVGGIEAQGNGNPHGHFLIDQFIDDGWLANA
jgi:hypothetical protein